MQHICANSLPTLTDWWTFRPAFLWQTRVRAPRIVHPNREQQRAMPVVFYVGTRTLERDLPEEEKEERTPVATMAQRSSMLFSGVLV